MNILSTLFLGWPAIVVTVILALIGLFRRDYRFLVVAAILAVPFSWVLSGFPIVRSLVFLAPVLIFGAGWAMNRGREMLAWILAVPYFLTILLLLFALFSGA